MFYKNRDRLLEGDIAVAFMDAVLNLPRVKTLLSDEQFSVNGTLIQAWATLAKVPPSEAWWKGQRRGR